MSGTGGALRPVGISQRIRLEWLNESARLAQAGRDRAQVVATLDEMLRDQVSVGGTATRGNKEKTITILARIWCGPPPHLVPLRDAGLGLFDDPDPTSRLSVHWGMTMAVYPFWSVVATQAGRLLRLQGAATAAQVRQRVQEQYGERPTVARATRRVLRSFVDWRALADTDARGRYARAEPHPVSGAAQAAWLAEAALHARASKAAPPDDLLHHPSMFPLAVPYVPPRALAAASPRLEVVRHGLDAEMLALRTPLQTARP